MPLHPEIDAVRTVMREHGLLDNFSGKTAVDVRASMQPLEQMRRDVGPRMYAETDFVFRTESGDIGCRAYRPMPHECLPVIVYFHGGGFVLGGLVSHAHICRELADRVGAVVVSVDYRLAPEYQFPAAVDDAFAAVCRVYKAADELNLDQSRIALAGDSAGANLALVSAMRCRDEHGPRIKQLFLAYPGTDACSTLPSRTENADGYFLTTDQLNWFFEQYLGDDVAGDHQWVSPLHTASLAELPPTLIQTAQYDLLRDEGEALAERMKQSGVDAQSTRYDGAMHGFLGASTEPGRAALAEASAELRSAFGITDDKAE